MHYPDFLNNSTQDWWRRQLAAFHDMAPWDGLWIDMNEASNFCTGEVRADLRVLASTWQSAMQPILSTCTWRPSKPRC